MESRPPHNQCGVLAKVRSDLQLQPLFSLGCFILAQVRTNVLHRRSNSVTSILRQRILGVHLCASGRWLKMRLLIGGAEGDRTPGLRIANRTTGKSLSICLFKSCSHRRKSMVFTFFPIPYHRVYVASFFFGHVLATWKLTQGDSVTVQWWCSLQPEVHRQSNPVCPQHSHAR
jgi:hypothetical protein